MSVVRGVLVTLLLLLNTLFWGSGVLLAGVLKFFIGGELRRRLMTIAPALGDRWAGINHAIFDALLPTKWDIVTAGDLSRQGHYLIFSNHVSWTDIFVLYRTFHGRLAFIRFFIKQEMIWFPLVGQACWALDFPFMKRYTAEYLARHPEKRGRDLEATRRACRRYRRVPVAILNFLEGTRFTEEKKEEQQSPYRFLLRPRIGGAAFVLASLGDLMDGVIDVTIAYPGQRASIWDFASGRIAQITVRARRVEIAPQFFSAAAVERGDARQHLKSLIEAIWSEKDALLRALDSTAESRSQEGPPSESAEDWSRSRS